jgi:hypothetical protein
VQDTIYLGHPELAGAAWGFAPETATHVLRLVYGGVFDRQPEVQLIVGHLCHSSATTLFGLRRKSIIALLRRLRRTDYPVDRSRQ